MIRFSFCHNSPMDLLLGHFIRLTLSDIIVTLGWSHLRRTIPTSSFCRSTCQIFYASPSSYSWVIRTDRVHLMPYWGIFPSFRYGDDHFLTGLLQFSSLGREISYLLHESLFWRYSPGWAFIGAWHSYRDNYPSRLFSWDSLVDHSILSSWLASRAPFVTYGAFFRLFRWIESYATCHTRVYFPPSFPCSSAFRASVPS